MGAIAEAVAGLASGIANIGFGIYDRDYQARMNARDFDYQKSLQQEIFNREDTAVQRRMADLKAAGLNPNLAAGSAAGAGSVVGRSSTPGLPGIGNPVGTALDSAAAVAQLRAQRKQNEILDNQVTESNYKADLARYDYAANKLASLIDRAALYKQLGVDDIQLRLDSKGNASLWSPSFQQNGGNGYKLSLQNSPLMKQIDWQIQNNKNSADLLQRDVDFYVGDKIADYLGIGASIFSGAGSGWRNFNMPYKTYKK